MLISTRVRGILSNAAAVEVGVPSEEMAISIVMAAADMTGSVIPPEAAEICRLCGRLPLALGMAGKLIKSLDLDGKWEGVIEILRDELRDNEAMSSEQTVIKASLAAFKGSAKDKEGMQNLFKLFGCVPEDTVCPLAALAIMYDAVYSRPASRGRKVTKTPLLNIRKWLKILCDRSL